MRPENPAKSVLRFSLPLVLVALLVGAGVAPSSADLIDDTYDDVPSEEVLAPEQYWVVEMADQVKESLPQSDIPDPCDKAGPLLVKEWLEPGHYVDMVVPEFHMYVAPPLTTFEDLTVHGGLFAMADLDITGDFHLAPQGIIATADGYVPGGITIDGTWTINGTVVAGNGKRPVPSVDTQSGHFPGPREFVGEDGIDGAAIHLIAQSTDSTAAEGCFGPGKGSKGGNPCLPIAMGNPSGVLVRGGDGGDGGKFKLTLATAAGGGSYASGDYSGWADFMSDGTHNATMFLRNGGHGAHAIFSVVGPGAVTAIGGAGGLSGWIDAEGFEVSFDTVKPYIVTEPTGGNGGTALPMMGLGTNVLSPEWFTAARDSTRAILEEEAGFVPWESVPWEEIVLPPLHGDDQGPGNGMIPGPVMLPSGLNIRLACEGERHYADPSNMILDLLESLGYPWGPSPMGHDGTDEEELLWWIAFVLEKLQEGEYIGDDEDPGYPAEKCIPGDQAPNNGPSNTDEGADSEPFIWFDEYGHERLALEDAGRGGSGGDGTKGGDATGLSAHGGPGGDGLFFGGRGGLANTGPKTCAGGTGSHGGNGAKGGDAITAVLNFCEEWEVTLTTINLTYEGLAVTENVAHSMTVWVAMRFGEILDEKKEEAEDAGEEWEPNDEDAEAALKQAEAEWEMGVAGTIEHSYGVTHEKGTIVGGEAGTTWFQESCAPSAVVHAAGGTGGDAGTGGPGGHGSHAWATGGNGGRAFMRGGDGGGAIATGGTGGQGGNGGIPGAGGEGANLCVGLGNPLNRGGERGNSQGGAGGPGGTATGEGGAGGESFLGSTSLASRFVSQAPGGNGLPGFEDENDGAPGPPGHGLEAEAEDGSAQECNKRERAGEYAYRNGHE